MEVPRGNLRHDQEPHIAPSFFARKVNSALSLRHFSDSSKQIDFPKGRKAVAVISVVRDVDIRLPADIPVISHLRVILGTSHPKQGPLLLDLRHRRLEVVVIL